MLEAERELREMINQKAEIEIESYLANQSKTIEDKFIKIVMDDIGQISTVIFHGEREEIGRIFVEESTGDLKFEGDLMECMINWGDLRR